MIQSWGKQDTVNSFINVNKVIYFMDCYLTTGLTRAYHQESCLNDQHYPHCFAPSVGNN